MRLDFAKGHGTRNDFVVLADPDNLIELTAAQVAHLCDRRGGIGGDGVLRAVRANLVPEWSGADDLWFMDYRNADGSIAEMCGNGLRVFLRFLAEEGLVSGEQVSVATRSGERTGRFLADGRIAVTMGEVELGEPVRVSLGEESWAARSVSVGNPHAVAILPDVADLEALDLTTLPAWEPAAAFPEGVNVEFVVVEAPGRLRLRVHERGVGETESCGTGVVAAAAAAGAGERCTVEVRGGTLEVDLTGPQAELTGPALIVARGTCLLTS